MISRGALWFHTILGAMAGGLVGVSLAVGDYFLAGMAFILALTNLVWPVLHKRSYERGWISGRAAMIEAMPQAFARGMTPFEFVTAELERDGFRYGVVVRVEKPEETEDK